MILKGSFGLTLLITLSLLYTLASRQWAAAVPLAFSSAMLFYFTRLFVRFQTGSAGLARPTSRWRAPTTALAGAWDGNSVRCSICRWKRWGHLK
jgi:hypothetical protein